MIEQYIMPDILEEFSKLPFAAGITLLYILIEAVRHSRKKKKMIDSRGDYGFHLLFRACFVMYFVILLDLVFFCREAGSRMGTDMTLFGTWGTTARDHAYVLENVLLFIPYGLLFPFMIPERLFWLTPAAGCLTSVFIEITQLITSCGFCQLDDMVMNTAGTILGFVFYILLRKKFS